MLKLCRTKMALPPHPTPTPHRPAPINKHSWSFIFERIVRQNSVKHLMSKRKVRNCEALKGLAQRQAGFGLYQNALGTNLSS